MPHCGIRRPPQGSALHDADHDIRTPTHELTAPRRSRQPLGWALGPDGPPAGVACSISRRRRGGGGASNPFKAKGQ
ncbi:hypothetical protein CN085_28305 [Sinorhizobium meliloti]|nr:hypothetical protein CN085_28305 [Sinorhizobium meliloti]